MGRLQDCLNPRSRFNAFLHVLRTLWNGFIALTRLGILFNPWSTSSSLVEDLLNIESEAEADFLMERWKTQKLEELSLVALVSTLISGLISASFSWKLMQDQPTAASSCWYSSLLLSVVAITSALQQSNNLRKITAGTKGNRNLRQLLDRDFSSLAPEDGRRKESQALHFVFQTPIMLLNFAIDLYIVGLLILVFGNAVARGSGSFGKEINVRPLLNNSSVADNIPSSATDPV
ncbi:hypothetical protein EV356DRAFT_213313 [Viridothelium virens]|uniref:Uncharacterized protein n=1 Tax=Viridothelium virens TaxID=1048519 RepID=A0A6A6H614_VIRVR|nr:hypothetical protein EV356DRAFT_213313 [Viridothelium virens]